MLESLAAGAAAGIANYFMGESHADEAQKRQLELMDRQHEYNRADALSSYSNQVQSMRMAGLSPASLDGRSNPIVSSPVSQGAAAKGDSSGIDPATALLKAQKENIEADTRKKNEETGNVKEDTALKFAQTLFTGKNADKVDEETTRIKQINEAYVSENENLSVFGQAMAEKWTSSPWFDKLAPDTKDTIRQIADGSVPLSVGAMQALRSVVAAQTELSEGDRKMVQNAFDNAMTEAVFSDKSVMQALVKEPVYRQRKLKADISKINAELPEIRAKVANLMSDLETKKLSREQLNAQVQSFKRNDLGYLKSQGEYGKWLEGYAETMLLRLFPMVVGGVAVKGFGSSKPSPSNITQPTIHGVQDFHF